MRQTNSGPQYWVLNSKALAGLVGRAIDTKFEGSARLASRELARRGHSVSHAALSRLRSKETETILEPTRKALLVLIGPSKEKALTRSLRSRRIEMFAEFYRSQVRLQLRRARTRAARQGHGDLIALWETSDLRIELGRLRSAVTRRKLGSEAYEKALAMMLAPFGMGLAQASRSLEGVEAGWGDLSSSERRRFLRAAVDQQILMLPRKPLESRMEETEFTYDTRAGRKRANRAFERAWPELFGKESAAIRREAETGGSD